MNRRTRITVRCVSLAVLSIFSIFSTAETSDIHSKGNPMPTKAIDQVLKEHTKTLMSIPGVVGTGQGLCDDKPCIKVFVIEKTLEIERRIPDMLNGYPVRVEETGPIKALPKR